MTTANDIIQFWFEEHGPEDWWGSKQSFDEEIENRFLDTHTAATRGELFEWRDEPQGRLAEILLLDQFSRQLYRGKAEAFRWDEMALTLAQEALRAGADEKVDKDMRGFFYMPFMHSESKVIHAFAVDLYKEKAPEMVTYLLDHKKVIDRFGRYPHRNNLLDRKSTPEECAYLEKKGNPFEAA